MKLTDKQQMMVDVNDRDILVSAAAGSGKTATMVETVVDKVTDKDYPIDIDKVLMVTFSNLAANQMKEKIRARFEKILEEHPEDEHIARQLVLVNRADICTIDKFCKKLVTENYDRLGIDASFNIADDGMTSIMENEVLDSIFERKYSELVNSDNASSEYADFGMLCNFICKDNDDDSALRKSVIKLYKMAMKQPKPRKWLKEAIAATNVKSVQKLEKQGWVKDMLAQQRRINDSCRKNAKVISDLASMLADRSKIDNLLDAFIDKLDSISSATTYSQMYELKSKRNPSFYRDKLVNGGEDPYIVDRIRDCYDALKAELDSGFKLKQSPDQIVEIYTEYRKYYIPLILLTMEFMEEYELLKKQKKLFEFSDISHMAYDLVCVLGRDGRVTPTKLAKEISERYMYIFIDEYQDGDYIQEGILTCISRSHKGIHNMYMIGDVKQSIYGFRNARPDIFLGKYNTYKECTDVSTLADEDKNIKLLLNENFRSRGNVLNAANFVFWQLMDKSLGGLDYGEDTMLVEGILHPESPSNVKTEILIAKAYDETSESKLSRDELETSMIVKKIDEILNGDKPMMVLKEDYRDILSENPDMTEAQKAQRLYRRVEAKDIAILLRSVKGMGTMLGDALNDIGIMTNIDTSDGYYEATELRIVIALLEIIDNVYRDIPLEAVLVSPIGKLDENEMTLVSHLGMDKEKSTGLYERCRLFMDRCEAGELAHMEEENINGYIRSAYEKLADFFEKLSNYRYIAKNISVSGLIWKVITETGYYDYAYSMPGGNRRKANLDKLIDIAAGFEGGAYKGLFQFLQYINKYDIDKIDVGEANASGENMNAVRIMTMHKSKGLEYPVVFVSRLCNKISVGDKESGRIGYNNKYYLTGKAIDDINRCSADSSYEVAVKDLEKVENFAEEMRILYVAMTRAKEKLYLTGCESKKFAESLEKKYSHIGMCSLRLPYDVRFSDQGYMAWIECAYKRLLMLENGEKFTSDITDSVGRYLIENGREYFEHYEYEYKELEKYITHTAAKKAIDFEGLLGKAMLVGLNSYYEDLEEIYSYEYKYSPYTHIGAKYSVTGIKKYAEDSEVTQLIEKEPCETVEENRSETSKGAAINEINVETGNCETGSDIGSKTNGSDSDSKTVKNSITAGMRGTIVHKFMELVPFEELQEGLNWKDYSTCACDFRDAYVSEHIFSDDEAAVIPMYHIGRFFESNLGQRMIKAAKRHELFKEKGFTKTFPASMVAATLNAEAERLKICELAKETEEDVVIVQGIIDGFFYEDGKVILMDYKTDSASPEEIKNRHKEQLEYYGEVIESLLDKKVEESILYSFHNDTEIYL